MTQDEYLSQLRRDGHRMADLAFANLEAFYAAGAVKASMLTEALDSSLGVVEEGGRIASDPRLISRELGPATRSRRVTNASSGGCAPSPATRSRRRTASTTTSSRS